jgi:hypothetical protein
MTNSFSIADCHETTKGTTSFSATFCTAITHSILSDPLSPQTDHLSPRTRRQTQTEQVDSQPLCRFVSDRQTLCRHTDSAKLSFERNFIHVAPPSKKQTNWQSSITATCSRLKLFQVLNFILLRLSSDVHTNHKEASTELHDSAKHKPEWCVFVPFPLKEERQTQGKW